MNRIVEEMKTAKVFYLATCEKDQPRVRPFGSVTEIDGQVYICTNNTKDCYRQIQENPNVEICGMLPDGKWIRVTARAVRDDRDEAREAMLNDPTGPRQLYTVGDGFFEVLRLEDAVCTRYSFSGEPEVITST